MKTGNFTLLTEDEFLKLCVSCLGSMGARKLAPQKVAQTWALYKEGSSEIYHAKPHILYVASWIMSTINRSDPSKGVFIPSLIIATLYHDAIYVVGAKDNEELSAELTVRDLVKMGVPDKQIRRVSSNIMHTKHMVCPEDQEGRCMVDADLASLTTPDIRNFWANTNRLWKESGKDAATFAPLNSGFLRMLANRGVYKSLWMTKGDEQQAQDNIADIIELLDTNSLGVMPVTVVWSI